MVAGALFDYFDEGTGPCLAPNTDTLLHAHLAYCDPAAIWSFQF